MFRKYQSGALGYDVRGVRLQIMKISNEIDSNWGSGDYGNGDRKF